MFFFALTSGPNFGEYYRDGVMKTPQDYVTNMKTAMTNFLHTNQIISQRTMSLLLKHLAKMFITGSGKESESI